MSELLVVIGAGGFGREALDVAQAINAAATEPVWDILGVIDDAPSSLNLGRLRDRDIPSLGGLADLHDDAHLALAIGAPLVRRRMALALSGRGQPAATLIHPAAVLGSRTVLNHGVIVCGGVVVGTNVSLGQHVHLNPCAVIGHDTVLANFVSVNPNATVSGDCHVEEGALLGAASFVLQGLRIGSFATVGAAACVVNEVPASAVVKGIPAR
jgi:sugar O-acyltransferase (sialic acid O-acetyltransferase NeuD family)